MRVKIDVLTAAENNKMLSGIRFHLAASDYWEFLGFKLSRDANSCSIFPVEESGGAGAAARVVLMQLSMQLPQPFQSDLSGLKYRIFFSNFALSSFILISFLIILSCFMFVFLLALSLLQTQFDNLKDYKNFVSY